MKTRQSIKGGCPFTLCQVQCATEIHSNPSSAFPNKQLIQTKEIWFMFTTNTQTHSLTHTQRKDSLLVNLPLRCLPNPPCWQPSIRVCPSSPEDKNTDWKKKKKDFSNWHQENKQSRPHGACAALDFWEDHSQVVLSHTWPPPALSTPPPSLSLEVRAFSRWRGERRVWLRFNTAWYAEDREHKSLRNKTPHGGGGSCCVLQKPRPVLIKTGFTPAGFSECSQPHPPHPPTLPVSMDACRSPHWELVTLPAKGIIPDSVSSFFPLVFVFTCVRTRAWDYRLWMGLCEHMSVGSRCVFPPCVYYCSWLLISPPLGPAVPS